MRIIIILIFLVCISYDIGYTIDAGNTCANFLKIGIGARATGMGGAYTAISDDISGSYWNPAGLGQLQHNEIFLMHNIWLQDIQYNTIAVGMSTGYGFWSISGNLVTTLKSMNEIDIHGNILNKRWNMKSGYYNLSWGYSVTDNLCIGLSVKSIFEQIGTKQGSCWAGDIGILYNLLPCLRLGIVYQNIGNKIRLIHQEYPLPFTVKIAELFKFSNLLCALEMNFPVDNEPFCCLGIEYKPIELVAFRFGWRSYDEGLGSLHGIAEGITLGIGINIKDMYIDYAYIPYGFLGDTHQVSLRIILDGKKLQQTTKASIMKYEELKEEEKIDTETIPQPHPPLVDTPMPTQPREEAIIPQETESKQLDDKKELIDEIRVVQDNTKVYSEPNASSTVIAIIDKDTQVVILDTSQKWYYKVRLPDGRVGYISYVYIK